MQKYNRNKRGTYNARIHKININDACDGQAQRIHIHIHARYDGQRRTQYDKGVFTRKTQSKAQRYINITNTINDIFPDINKPHNAHTYNANAPYHRIPPEYTRTYIPRYLQGIDADKIMKDTRTVKCIIINDDDDIIYIGHIRRTRTVNVTQGTIDITLHKGARTMQAYEHAIDPDRIIHNITVREIKAHDVEIYYV